MHTRVIGIDLAVTAPHKAVVYDPATDDYIGRVQSFGPQASEMDRVWQLAHVGTAEPVQVVVICEATGMAWYPVCVYFHARGAHIYRVHGGRTRAMRQVLYRYAGSDHIDCRTLAKYYVVARKRLHRWTGATGAQLALQRACREAHRWRMLDVAIQNRLQAYDAWAWGGLRAVVPAEARDWVRQTWYDPWHVVAAGGAQLSAAWQAAAPQTPALVDWIPAWLQRAQQLIAVYGSPDHVGYAELQAQMGRELALQAQARAAKRALSRTLIQPLYRQLYPQRRLETLQGIGADSAATYMAFIQDIARFPSVAQFRSWCGIIPRSHQSGTFEAKHMPLTQAGPNLIKALLYLNANVARQWDVQLAALYYRQMVEYGKHHTQAVCACASHLASRIYAVLKQDRDYELRDLQQRPISRTTARQLCETYRVPPEVRQRTTVRARKQRQEHRTEERFQKQHHLA